MKKYLGYYQKWYNKWIKILHYLWWECEQSFKVKCLANKVQKHIWLIEWRLLCVIWFDDKAEESSLFPKTLRYE